MREFGKDATRSKTRKGNIADADAVKNALISFHDLIIEYVEIFFGGVKTVEIFHKKFATAEDAGFGAFFVTEFGLKLVNVEREVFVALDVVFDHHSDWFFVSGGESEFSATG